MRAPGGPGAVAPWGPGHKQAFGAAPGPARRVWFTLARGSLSDVFHPAVDSPLVQGLRFIVAAPDMPPIDDAAEARHGVRWLEPGVPAFRVDSEHAEYSLTKEFVADTEADALVISGVFQPGLPDVRLYLQLVPHGLADGMVLEGEPPALVARRGPTWIALVGPFGRCSAGYLNSSDLFVDLHDNDGVMTAQYTSAPRGHVALGAEMGITGGAFQLALGLGESRDGAEEAAHSAMTRGARAVRESFVRAWRAQPGPDRNMLKVAGDGGALALASMAVLHCLEDRRRPGAFIAAPAAPWGGAARPGTAVCNRDLFHVASALLDAGDPAAARRALGFLEGTQRPDGSWAPCAGAGGAAREAGVGLDQVALPVLLAWRLGVAGALDRDPYPGLVRRAAAYLLAHGPRTEVDRWMDAGGMSPSTLAVTVAALVAAADFADDAREPAAAEHLRAVADYWQDRVEAWTYADGQQRFVRLADPEAGPCGDDAVGLEFLELVRRGLRAPDDPRVLRSLAGADAALKVALPAGAAWRRFTGDTYGEADDGSPWSEASPGRGRAWPLLIGERAHHALACGEPAGDLVRRLEACAGPELVLSAQVWDGEDRPQRDLFVGAPTGDVAPFGWAHAEYLRLLAAVATSRLPDVVEPVRRRYVPGRPPAPPPVWSHAHRVRSFPQGRGVRVQLRRPGAVVWTSDGWATSRLVHARETGLGCWVADLATQDVPAGGEVEWTANYASGRGEGGSYRLTPVAGLPERRPAAV